jgi:hypothetical protein
MVSESLVGGVFGRVVELCSEACLPDESRIPLATAALVSLLTIGRSAPSHLPGSPQVACVLQAMADAHVRENMFASV